MARAYSAGMLRRAAVTVALATTLATTTAHALKPRAHADLAHASCTAAGLPTDFCRRVATENYNTDADEWDDLAAHAQIAGDQTACEAADGTAGRVWLRATELRAELAALATDRSERRAGKAAELLGRVLHTIQDNCAHHGMPNPQHAWFSLADFCEGTDTSPDVQDEAVACARVETEAVMRLVAATVSPRAADALGELSCPDEAIGDQRGGTQPVCQRRYLPAPWDACEFLGEAQEWDGIDRQWNNDVVTGALRDAFAAGLAGRGALPSPCRGDERTLSPAVSEPILDVSGGTPSCTRAKLFCLGKADEDDHPFADEDTEVPAEAGCRTTHAPGGLVVFGLAALVLRRRRRA